MNKWQILNELGKELTLAIEIHIGCKNPHCPISYDELGNTLLRAKNFCNKLKSSMIKKEVKPLT
jgi:hypothetical protein